ncbi:MAG: GntR family transcriptional regulator, partial [Halanaerobiales bacterium]
MKNHNFSNDKPLYLQISDYILEKIKDHSYDVGDTIPPERDLSQQFNVSRVTVRKAIKELVHLGYLYRVQGKGTFVFGKDSVNIKKNKSIGVILDYCHKELESRILKGIEEILDMYNYSMTFKSSNNDYKKEAETIQRMKNEGIEGLIILPAEDQKDSTAIVDLKSEQYPFVLIDRRLQDCETDCVMSDNKNGSYLAVEYLFQLGHERVGFIKGNYSHTSSIEDRITGYRNALDEYSIGFDENLIFSYDFSLDETEKNKKLYHFYLEE